MIISRRTLVASMIVGVVGGAVGVLISNIRERNNRNMKDIIDTYKFIAENDISILNIIVSRHYDELIILQKVDEYNDICGYCNKMMSFDPNKRYSKEELKMYEELYIKNIKGRTDRLFTYLKDNSFGYTKAD